MPKIIAYCAIHYGGEYLKEAIQAVHPYVEKIYMMYSEKPSYGYGTDVPCPETEEELKAIAKAASDKVIWMKIEAAHEGIHRGIIHKHADGYDGILAFDADEVYDNLGETLKQCLASPYRYLGFRGYINFWKSFNYACYDGFTPIRYINLNSPGGNDVVDATVYHFSTAQRMEIMRYKLLIHGHKAEIRPGWLEDIYQAWVPGMVIDKGLHLVSFDLWQAVPFDKTRMPDALKAHANYDKEVI